MTTWSKLEFLIFSPPSQIILCDVIVIVRCVYWLAWGSHDYPVVPTTKKFFFVLSSLKTEQTQNFLPTQNTHILFFVSFSDLGSVSTAARWEVKKKQT